MNAKLHVIERPSLENVPAMLRRIADKIEAGEYGDITEAVLVTNGAEIDVFGLGNADGTVAHYLLCAAAQKMLGPML